MQYLKFPTTFVFQFGIMTKKTLSIILLFSLINVCLSQSYNLEIEINNVEIDGVIYMAIYNNSDAFENDSDEKDVQRNRWVKNVVENINVGVYKKSIVLKKGIYAISLFIDSNDNKKLDKNLIGIPTEQYGFSNNAMGFLGKPSFKNASFELIKNSEIKIRLK